MGCHHVGQAGLELPTSGDLPAQPPKVPCPPPKLFTFYYIADIHPYCCMIVHLFWLLYTIL